MGLQGERERVKNKTKGFGGRFWRIIREGKGEDIYWNGKNEWMRKKRIKKEEVRWFRVSAKAMYKNNIYIYIYIYINKNLCYY